MPALRRVARFAPALVIAMGLLLRAGALGAPFWLDDLAHHAMLEGRYPAARAPWDLYAFATADPRDHQALMARGVLPWWTSDGFRLAMLRPLPSLLRAADHGLFGPTDARAAHVHSLAWLAALLVLAHRFFARVAASRGTALLALTLLAVHPCLSVPTAWLAQRATLVSGALGLAALLAQTQTSTAVRWAWLVLALLSGEYAWGVLALVAVLPPEEAPGARRRVLAGVLAAAAVTRLGGYGASGSWGYLDPGRDPWTFLQALPERVSALTTDLLSRLPAEWDTPSGLRPMGLAAAGIVAGLTYRLFDPRERLRLLRAAAAAAVAVLLLTPGPPNGRVLLAPALAVSLGTAWVLTGLWRASSGAWPVRLVRRAFVLYALVVFVPVSALMSAWGMAAFVASARADTDALERGAASLASSGAATVVLSHAPTVSWLHHLPYTHGARTVRVLSMQPVAALDAHAPGVLSATLTAPVLEDGVARLLQDPQRPLRAGHAVRLGAESLQWNRGAQGLWEIRWQGSTDRAPTPLPDPAPGVRAFEVP